MTIKLMAVAETQFVDLGSFESLAGAQQRVEAMEADGSWPTGFDAVATEIEGGRRFVLTDEWEPVDG